MTEAELFTRCGKALAGPGPRWKEQIADMFCLRVNSVDNMSKGDSRVPPNLWLEIRGKLQDLYAEDLRRLMSEIDRMQEAMPAQRGDEFQTAVTNGPRRGRIRSNEHIPLALTDEERKKRW